MAKRLNEKQIAAIEYLAAPGRAGMTYGEIAEKVGVTERGLYNWRQDDDFNDALVKRTIRNASEHLPDIMDAVPRHIIDDGNAAMLRTYLQAIGALTERVEIDNKSAQSDMDDIKARIESMRKQDE